jgi:hypothetical protein
VMLGALLRRYVEGDTPGFKASGGAAGWGTSFRHMGLALLLSVPLVLMFFPLFELPGQHRIHCMSWRCRWRCRCISHPPTRTSAPVALSPLCSACRIRWQWRLLSWPPPLLGT